MPWTLKPIGDGGRDRSPGLGSFAFNTYEINILYIGLEANEAPEDGRRDAPRAGAVALRGRFAGIPHRGRVGGGGDQGGNFGGCFFVDTNSAPGPCEGGMPPLRPGMGPGGATVCENF